MTLAVDIRHAQGGFLAEIAFRSSGRLTCLFGRSGAGKTTLVNAIAGLIRPREGRIAVGDTVLLDTGSGVFLPKHRRRVGYVFQEGRLFPHLTVRQNLLFGRWFTRGESGGPDLGTVVELLGIGHLLARRPGTLSGGEKQRVAIGRALLARPRLLLMDEPLAALDEARKAEILPYIERLRDEAGVPIVYVSHSVAEVARLADMVVVLDGGRVAATGPAAEVLSTPRIEPLAEDPRSGAVLAGTVVGREEAYGLTRVATEAGDLLVPGLRPIGGSVRLLVPAREVMVATERPTGISALNVLSGEVAGIEAARHDAASVELRIACGDAHLLARVTRKSVDDLGLSPGRPVHALVKSMSFETATGEPPGA
ncbi:molybdenum ABC transporter ATP-binding protein [Enterovirga rhinocerotis]|uniref:Molybdate transport system ATP-binding protein n=1 Tax=Enterovirga rhinocerotis TaxID=1339210 RepID=A0A4V3DYN2_9HYPH|nr:molybdenum ABC transporter ATP-binding protein [Enterovirga rhinocerotis]TDR93329.1 molybdate transport system ATP-binding protein [Enterovirga rhinocerotis]